MTTASSPPERPDNNPLSGLLPRGSLGLKLLLTCVLVLGMAIPLLFVGVLVGERQSRAFNVTQEIGAAAGGMQIVGGPVLLAPTVETIATSDEQGRTITRQERSAQLIFATTGEAQTSLTVPRPLRRLGIYRAAVYTAETDFTAAFDPAASLADLPEGVSVDWAQARIVMFVRDSRAIREAVVVRFGDGREQTLEPLLDADLGGVGGGRPELGMSGLQMMAAPALPVHAGPGAFTVASRVVLTGAQRFSLAPFAMETTAQITGDWRSTRAEGYFQTAAPMTLTEDGFAAEWRVPFIARGLPKAGDVRSLGLNALVERDLAVTFSAVADVYRGVMRAVQYALMFIGIVFLAAFVFEAVGGRRAHPAQFVLVGLAQCVFYLLLLSITEIIGFTPAFLIAAAATIALLTFYAASAFRSAAIGVRALVGLIVLYGAMYVLMTMEDYALLAGSIVAFLVVAGAMIATRQVDWYGKAARAGD